MRIKFLQAAHLCGKDYAFGTHEVPEAALQDKYFHSLLKAGLVVDGEAAQVAPKSKLDLQRDLAEKLAKPRVLAPQEKQPVQPVSLPVIESEGEEPVVQESLGGEPVAELASEAEEFEAPKKKNKRKK